MRVISQSGTVDVPYENVALTIDKAGGYVIHGHTAYEYKACLLAKYSTEEKALKAMEMLRILYEDRECWNAYFYDYPKRFRFPADEDLEV